MPLVVLGLIALGAAILLVWISVNPNAGKPREGAGPRIKREGFRHSADGKIVYMFERFTGGGETSRGAGRDDSANGGDEEDQGSPDDGESK
jgi:hypothetical protein